MRRFLFFALVAIGMVACHAENETVSRTTLPKEVGIEVADASPMGATRSYEEALAIAEQSISLLESGDETRAQRRVIRGDGQCVTRATTRSGGVADTLFYIFNFENNDGFSVVAANRNVSPLIAVTEQGNYTYGEPTGVEPFDKYMEIAMENATRAIIPPDTPIWPPILPPDPRPQQYTEEVDELASGGPLATTRWAQRGVYGAFCPNGLAGCAATAFGQVMAYHRYPTTLYMSHLSSPANMTFNWNRMLAHNWSDSVTACSCGNCDYTKVGLLLREIGHRMQMDYHEAEDEDDKNSSGTNAPNIQSGIHSLGYNATLAYPSTIQAFWQCVKSDIDNQQPSLLMGFAPPPEEDGHAWIADGYYYSAQGTRYFRLNPNYNPLDPLNGGTEYIMYNSTVVEVKLLHCNWGASNGLCNGFFSIHNFTLNEAYNDWYDEGVPTGAYNNPEYNDGLALIYDISPDI